jgi:hypothetical protein
MSEKEKDEKKEASSSEPQTKKSAEGHSKTHTLKVYIDRIEDDVATIVMSDDDKVHFNLPAKLLPEGAEGGDHFELVFKPDKESAKAVKAKADDLLKDLLGQK